MIFKTPEERGAKYMNSKAYNPNSYAAIQAGRIERTANLVRGIKLFLFATITSVFIGLMLYLSIAMSNAGTMVIEDDHLSYVCRHYGVYENTEVSGGQIYVNCHHWRSGEKFTVHVPVR